MQAREALLIFCKRRGAQTVKRSEMLKGRGVVRRAGVRRHQLGPTSAHPHAGKPRPVRTACGPWALERRLPHCSPGLPTLPAPSPESKLRRVGRSRSGRDLLRDVCKQAISSHYPDLSLPAASGPSAAQAPEIQRGPGPDSLQASQSLLLHAATPWGVHVREGRSEPPR